jgi:hypothetical protein
MPDDTVRVPGGPARKERRSVGTRCLDRLSAANIPLMGGPQICGRQLLP